MSFMRQLSGAPPDPTETTSISTGMGLFGYVSNLLSTLKTGLGYIETHILKLSSMKLQRHPARGQDDSTY